MQNKADKRKQSTNPAVSAVMDAIRSTPLTLPHTRKVFREIVKDLAEHEVKFSEQMKKVEEELALGCRRTQGDIV